MEKIISQEAGMPEKQKTGTFNFAKLQAALCIAVSAAVSIALITWAIKTYL